MMTWSLRRQILYGVGALLALALILAYPAYRIVHRAPSCTDGVQNENELGIDCGGPCARACVNMQAGLTVNWARFFRVGDGVYDIAASVENKNDAAGIPDLGYTFTLYDDAGDLLATKSGTTFVNPREEAILFAPTVRVSGTPARADLTLKNDSDWYQVSSQQKRLITVRDQALLGKEVRPTLSATLVNTTPNDLSNIEAEAVVYGSDEPVGVSSTRVDALAGDGTAHVSFYWPLAFAAKTPTSGCTAPADVMLLLDRSGSMRGKPLADALRAAGVFVDQMTGADQVGVVSFATDASDPIDAPLSLDHSAAKSALGAITIGAGTQYTNMSAALDAASHELSSSRARGGGVKHAIVALTDGVANRPLDPSGKDAGYGETAAAHSAAAAKNAGISLYAIGLGREVNTDFLKTKIASATSTYYAAGQSGELGAIYQNIAEAVCKEELFTTKIFARVNEIPPQTP